MATVLIPIYLFLFGPLRTSDSSSEIVIRIVDVSNSQSLITNGSVSVDLGKSRRPKKVTHEGEVHYSEVAEKYLDQPLKITYNDSEYEAKFPDSLFTAQDGVINFPVKKKCNSCKVFGSVERNGRTNPNIIVEITDLHLRDTTDESGNFEIIIPDSLQKKEYFVRVHDYQGNILWKNYVTPSPYTPLPIILEGY